LSENVANECNPKIHFIGLKDFGNVLLSDLYGLSLAPHASTVELGNFVYLQ